MENVLFALIVITGLSHICRSQVTTPHQTEQTSLLDKLLETYDPRIRPAGMSFDGEVQVTIGLDVLAVTALSEYDQEFTVNVRLLLEWMDYRLIYQSKGIKSLPLTDPNKIWTPEIYFVNENDAELHQLMKPNRLLSILPSGMVRYSSRMTLSLWCKMQLGRFPFDTQICNIQMASHAYRDDGLRLRWRNMTPVNMPNPHQINAIGFTLVDGKTFSSENNQHLELRLMLRRELFFYTLHTFLPSAALVALSWLSFWVDRRAVVARLLIILFAISGMFSITADVEATVPHVPYLKAVDFWTGGCFVFLVVAVLELALVHTAADDRRLDRSSSLGMKPLVGKCLPSRQEPEMTVADTPSPSPAYLGLLNVPRDPDYIEHVARTLVPGLFGVFSVGYFTVLSVLSDTLTL